ncbi:MAG: glycosyltransferase, partial [Phormidesmis sp.]
MQQRILETYINRTDYVKACDRIQSLAQSHQSSYIVAANVHVVMLAYWQSDYKYVLDRAALITPDGMPLVW